MRATANRPASGGATGAARRLGLNPATQLAASGPGLDRVDGTFRTQHSGVRVASDLLAALLLLREQMLVMRSTRGHHGLCQVTQAGGHAQITYHQRSSDSRQDLPEPQLAHSITPRFAGRRAAYANGRWYRGAAPAHVVAMVRFLGRVAKEGIREGFRNIPRWVPGTKSERGNASHAG